MVSVPGSAVLNRRQATRIAVAVVVGATVLGGFSASTGGFVLFSGTSSEQDPKLPSTQTPIATTSPTPTARPPETSTSTAVASPTPSEAELSDEYEHVRQEYLERWSELNLDDPTVPELLGTEVRMDQNALWVVFDETDVHENASRMRDEWTAIANGYLFALDDHTGAMPERMVAVGWNNTGPITHFRVETDTAQALIQDDIEYNTFYNRFFRTVRATNDAERSIARDIAEHPPDDN